MKNILSALIILFSSVSMAENLCPTNTDIPDDMRLPESHYSKENASAAIDFLSEIVKKDISAGEWVNVPNALKTIDGYIRKKKCIEQGSEVGGWKCSEFCSFMESSFVYD